jgi:hypothetical protein
VNPAAIATAEPFLLRDFFQITEPVLSQATNMVLFLTLQKKRRRGLSEKAELVMGSNEL